MKVCHVCPNKVDVQTSDSVTETSKISRGLRIIPSCKQKMNMLQADWQHVLDLETVSNCFQGNVSI